MATQLTNFVVDHALRLMMVSKSTGEFMWSINQISDPSLSVAVSDTRTITDALGGTIMELENGKSAELSGNSSLFDLHLYAAQMGREVEKATSTAAEEVQKYCVAPAWLCVLAYCIVHYRADH